MKKTSLLILFFSLSTLGSVQAQKKGKDPVLLTVAGEKITVSEFEQVYNKNNTANPNIEQKSVDEYMELFINFKLKVKEAESLGMDTVTAYKKELNGYIDQLSAPYLVDREYTESLIREAYDRMAYDIKASHILVRVGPDDLPSDTLKAYNKIKAIHEELKSGGNFEEMAVEVSQDPSAKENKGALGYFTVFRMVYPFETAAYETPAGEISRIIRTKYGYHVIKVHDRREAVGEIRAAHIMVRTDPQADQSVNQQAESKIREIYAKIEQGENFAQLARTYSDDRPTAARGGEIPWFGAGRMVPEFEQAAFALAEDGATSEPFQTQFGWHIVKRLEKKVPGTYEEEYEAIKRKVERDGRGLGSQKALVDKLMEEYKVKEYAKNLRAMDALIDSTYFAGEWKEGKGADMDAPLFVIQDKLYKQEKTIVKQSEFAAFLGKGAVTADPMPVSLLIDRYYEQFRDRKLLKYEADILKLKYPEYKALVQEYRDGILLFELMNQMVWNKAIEDSTGLEAYYEDHKQNFMWDDRVEGRIYTCSSNDKAQELRKLIEAGESDSSIIAQLNENTELGVSIEKGKFTKEVSPVLNEVAWQKGISSIISYDGSFVVVRIENVLQPQPKELKEARGIITSAYQNYLEDQWIQELRNKYSYQVDPEVMKQVQQTEG